MWARFLRLGSVLLCLGASVCLASVYSVCYTPWVQRMQLRKSKRYLFENFSHNDLDNMTIKYGAMGEIGLVPCSRYGDFASFIAAIGEMVIIDQANHR